MIEPGEGDLEDRQDQRDVGVTGDRPLEVGDADMLGFSELAERFAAALIDRASRDGIVVGLEGAWGSGKSSLLALTTGVLESMPEKRRPQILSFRPWLIGNRDALLTALFAELANTVDAMKYEAGDATGVTVAAMKKLAEDMRRYGGYLGAFAPAASLASLAGVPGAGLLEKGLKAFREHAKGDKKQPSLAATKSSIDATLKRINRRIIVMIDDVDRLEPAEIAEMLRLVRSVADFHNVVYVLCYDPDIVAEAVETAMRISSGRAYLEKIVQIGVRVPAPEPFALRRMFSVGLADFLDVEDVGVERRLANVVDVEGGRWLVTPRAVNRTLDALRFLWPALRQRVDAADMVWLQLTKIGNPTLYGWIEDYSAAMAAAGGRVSLGANAAVRAMERLTDALGRGGDMDEACRRLREFLPGVGVGTASERNPVLYQDVGEDDRSAAIAGQRLASPDHYRLYFALSAPTGAIVEADFAALWSALDNGQEPAIALLSQWVLVSSPAQGTKTELILARLRGMPAEALNKSRSTALLASLADFLDHPLAVGNVDAFLGPPCWRAAENLLPVLRERMGGDAREHLLEAFAQGSAIGWLTYLLRSETFAHGRFGDQSRPEDEWLLTDHEYDEVVPVMHARYAALGASGVLATPDPLSTLFAWSQSGAENEARSAVEGYIADDDRLVDLLERVASTVRSSSEGDYLVIRRETLEAFMDTPTIYSRISALAAGSGPLSERAAEVKHRLDRGQRF